MNWAKTHPVSTALIATIIFVAVMILWGLYAFGPDFLQDFGANWLATFLGLMMGIPLALWLSNYQEKSTEKEKKYKILASLKDELSYSVHELGRMLDDQVLKRESGVLSSLLRNELWRAYSDGGELQWIKDVDLLAQIADSYYCIRAIMDLSDRYYDSVQYATEEASPARIGEVFQTLKLAVDVGLRSIEDTIREINTTLA